MTTLSYEASGLDYTDWCKSVMNEYIKDKTHENRNDQKDYP